MSKWLRRGASPNFPDENHFLPPQQQQHHHHHPAELSHPPAHTEFPQPPRDYLPKTMASGSTSAAMYPQQATPPAGYQHPSAPPSAAIPMDIDHHHRSAKYAAHSPPPPYHPNAVAMGPNKQQYDRRSSDERRTASRERRMRSQTPTGTQPPPYHSYPAAPHSNSRTGPTHAPAMTQHHQDYVRNTPPPHTAMPYSKLGNATPPDSVQPSFPPPAVTAESPPPSEAAQRRPAYLLHRDLVIGKGSYGQVCIASRGEPEGHQAGRAGKRKKFACKCVLLRNDPKYIAKLQEEVNVLRELRGHTNVIRLYDVFCVDNELFIITELGRGGDLFHLLTTHPKHGVTEAYAGKYEEWENNLLSKPPKNSCPIDCLNHTQRCCTRQPRQSVKCCRP